MFAVGPARSGKTQIAIGAILEHDSGPVVASSVKTDVLEATLRWRIRLGDVAIYDPLGMVTQAFVDELLAPVRAEAARTGTKLGTVRFVGWSPVNAARSASGAQKVTRRIADAAPATENVTDASFWNGMAERFLWPSLHAAAISGGSMADVVRWVALGDAATTELDTTPEQILRDTAQHRSRATARDARVAFDAIRGTTTSPDDTRGGIYAAAQNLVRPWEDPKTATNAAKQSVDLAWLIDTERANTLYVIMPASAHDAKRMSVIFGGLLGQLTDEIFERVNTTGKPIRNLLMVLDEAGNSPLDWLPEVATTCASHGVTLMTLWQSLAQAEVLFGKRTETLLTNHLTKIFFGGSSDQTTLDTASRLAGQHEVLTNSTTDGASATAAANRRSVNANSTTVPVLAADLVRQIPPGHALCIHGTLPPIHLTTRKSWEDPELRRRVKGLTGRSRRRTRAR